MNLSRDALLDLDDRDLFRLCHMETFRASGPGGQHRNTTDSAVRLTLTGTAINAYAAEHRSQHKNRELALDRLRLEIALQLRDPVPPRWEESWQINHRNRRYPRLVAVVVDALEQHDYQVSSAADTLGLSTGKLIRLLAADPQLWAKTNQERQKRGQHPLRPPS